MNLNLLVIFMSLFYLVLITFLYFGREQERNLNFYVYKYMIGFAFIALGFDIIYQSGLFYLDNSLVEIVHYTFLLILACAMTVHLFFSPKDLIMKVENKMYFITLLFLFLILINLSMYLYRGNVEFFGIGLREIFLYFVIGVAMLVWIGYGTIKLKKLGKKKLIPIAVFILLVIPVMYVQAIDPNGSVIAAFFAFVVIVVYHTYEGYDKKILENELQEALEQVDKANFAKEEFLTEMSHQIRTPLNTIVGYSQIIEVQDISDNIKEDVQNIKTAAASLLDLVTNIIDVSKITVNELELVNDEYNIKDLLREVIAKTKERIGKKPIEFNIRIDESIPKYLYGDYHRLKQIIVNMLTNAIKKTDKGEIIFKVDAEKTEETCRLIIVIENTGVIRRDENEKMFENYEQLNIGQFQPMEESNISLAITSRLVELMNGSLIVNDELGHGIRVTIGIAQKIVTNCPKMNIDNIIHYDIENIKAADKRVLVVDDNKINLRVTTKLLANYGVKNDVLISGQECLDIINSGSKYDLILLDDMMPVMSGVETLAKLRKIEGFDTPVVVQTANATLGMREKYLKDGFDDYIAKPIERKELERVLVFFLKTGGIDANGQNLRMVSLGVLMGNEIDVEKGIRFLGGINAYNESLKDFVTEAPKKLNKLDEHLKANEFDNYAVLAHSFKTDAKYLGFTKLIDIAYRHEMESKNENLDYITNHYAELHNEVIRILDLLEKYLNQKT